MGSVRPVGPPDIAARSVIASIVEGPVFQSELARIAAELHLDPRTTARRARACLREMVSVQKPWVLRLYQWVLRPLYVRAWDQHVDIAGLERLVRLNEEQALVFLPSHRSYADPLVLGSVLRDRGLRANYTLPGANMAFWPLGQMLRRVGGITIRRSFRDDPVYKLAMREYFAYLVARRTNLEWYIEGGRSRTGKLRPPRYGLLRYLVDAIGERRAADAMLVPVSITYDQLAEVSAMAAEEQGAAKKPEGLGWLARYVRQQRRHVGAVHVRFGEPLALSEGLALGEAGLGNRRLAVERIAFEVCDRINHAAPVMANALIALALLGVHGRALTAEQVFGLVAPLLDYVVRRKLPASGLLVLHTAPGTAAVLGALTRAGLLSCYGGGTQPVYAIRVGQYNVAAFYRNNAIHWFVNRALVELAFLYVGEQNSGDPREQAWQEALRLRDLLKFEFFFARKNVFADQLMAELDLIDPQWQGCCETTEQARRLLAKSGFLVAHRVLRSFLESYLVVADLLVAADPAAQLDEGVFVARCAAVAEQYRLQGRLLDPEAISREGFANGLKLAANRGLLAHEGERTQQKRRELLAQLESVLARVAAVDEIETRRTRERHAIA